MTVSRPSYFVASNLCKNYNTFALTGVFAVENFCQKALTLRAGGYNIILILYLDRMRGDV